MCEHQLVCVLVMSSVCRELQYMSVIYWLSVALITSSYVVHL